MQAAASIFARSSASALARRSFSSTSAVGDKVAVLGAAGGIGQPMSMLLKLTGKVSHLSCYDLHLAKGVAADIGHISAPGVVTGHEGDAELGEALKGCKAVVIPAGVPRKPGMTRDDLFNTNATIVKNLVAAVAEHCPEAFICIISNPVNSTVPIAKEVLEAAGVYDKRKLFGVTTLDITRANKFVSDSKDIDANVTVVGGHAGTTILPVLSRVEASFSDEELKALTKRIQFGGDEVVQAKDGAGSATLSMAFAGARFTERLLDAANGESGVVECAFVESDAAPPCTFFSTPITLGPNGVEDIAPVGPLSALEQENYDAMIGDLEKQIAKGVAFAKSS